MPDALAFAKQLIAATERLTERADALHREVRTLAGKLGVEPPLPRPHAKRPTMSDAAAMIELGWRRIEEGVDHLEAIKEALRRRDV